ncbi:MAG TPA: tetratricopeptide repeat protein [Gammaproteobacteria bacterium]|jgi:tetratricopeptide (TPR) repeat protein|nr:tetratricopeptide repeat protein [Gammaproteobacteria bacterium]
MLSQRNRSLLRFLGVAVLLAVFQVSWAQQAQKKDEKASAPTIDAATGKVLNEAIELLNKEDYKGAGAKIATLNLDKLSPYERSKVEQILFNVAYSQEKYDEARGHLQKAIDAGGLNQQEIEQARYQSAQLYMQQEKWKEGAAALEDWFKTATKPNSAAYYLLAVAYYQQAVAASGKAATDLFGKALVPAKKAVELMEKPQESWLSMLSALYLQREEYKEAIPVLQQLVSIAPSKKAYWLQLSSIYGQMEDYSNSLAAMQLAYNAGLVTEDSEIRRLADLLLFNSVPYRGAQVLESAIEKKTVKLDDKLYEKLANCWIAAGEYDKAINPLQKSAELSSNGDTWVRLGELQVQREDWPAALTALQKGVEKGQLKDAGNAQLLMGIAYYSQKNYKEARPFFERAAQSAKHKQIATSYLQAIKALG